MLRRWAVAIALVLTGVIAVRADVFRPAYLELRQTSAETYDVMWKVPAQGDTLRLAIHVVFPEGTVNLSEPRGTFVATVSSNDGPFDVRAASPTAKDRSLGCQAQSPMCWRGSNARTARPRSRDSCRHSLRCRRAVGARRRCRLDLPRTRRSPHPGRHRPLALHPGDALPGQGLATDRRDDVSVYRDPQLDADRGGARVGPRPAAPSRRASR